MTPTELRARLQAPPGPVLDLHAHVRSGYGPQRARTPETEARRLLAAADRAGVTHLALSCQHPEAPHHPTPDQVCLANDLTLRACDQAPDRLLPFCYVNPEHTREALAEIDRCIGTHRFIGLKLWQAVTADDPRVIDVVAAAAEHGAPILQHAFDNVLGNAPGESTPDHVARLARAVPEARLILAHLNGIGLRGIERIHACTGLCVDTAGGDPETGMVEAACRRLGWQRVVFGSDCPRRQLGTQLGKVLGAAIPVAWKRAILWDNAVRLLPDWAKLEGALVA